MPQYVVRYGALRELGVFSTSRGETLPRGATVVARTKRGLEAGELLGDATERAVHDLRDSSGGQILRAMTSNDRNELSRIRAQERMIWDFCRKAIEDLQ